MRIRDIHAAIIEEVATGNDVARDEQVVRNIALDSFDRSSETELGENHLIEVHIRVGLAESDSALKVEVCLEQLCVVLQSSMVYQNMRATGTPELAIPVVS